MALCGGTVVALGAFGPIAASIVLAVGIGCLATTALLFGLGAVLWELRLLRAELAEARERQPER
jgi:hypothetical protein